MQSPPWGLVAVERIATTVGKGDRAVGAAASAQHGFVTTTQLHFLGLDRHAIAHRVRQGRLHRFHRGVYLVGHEALTDLGRLAAALLAYGPTALLCHWSAAFLWGLASRVGDGVHVMLPAVAGRHRDGVTVHRMASFDQRHRRLRSGLPLTSPALTILDLAEMESTATVEAILNEARQRRLVSQSELASLLHRSTGRAGLGILGRLFSSQTNDDFSRHEAEKILWRLIRSSGLPTPRRNVRVHGFELDFYWPELGLNVETDGYQWHSTRHKLNADRVRDAELSSHGIQVIRFSWDQLQRPNEVLANLAAAIALAGSRTT